jgi:hypothetical protein
MTRLALLVVPLLASVLIAAPVPKAKPGDGLIAFREGVEGGGARVMVVTPDGQEVARLDGFDRDELPWTVRLSGDGKRVAVAVLFHRREDDEPGPPFEVRVFDIAKPDKPAAVLGSDLRKVRTFWGADSNILYVRHQGGKGQSRVTVFDVAAGKGKQLELPEGGELVDVSANGGTLLVNKSGAEPKQYLADAATLKLTDVTRKGGRLEKLSPDGAKALGQKFQDPKLPTRGTLTVFDLKADTETEVKCGDDTLYNPVAVWNVDGTKLLVTRSVYLIPNGKTKTEHTLRDLDGSNPKAFLDGKYYGASGFDWR